MAAAALLLAGASGLLGCACAHADADASRGNRTVKTAVELAELDELNDQTSLLQHSLSPTTSSWHPAWKPDPNEKRCAPIRKTVVGHYVVSEDCAGMISPVAIPPSYPGSQRERDLDRPLSEVAREHPGENLYHYFGQLNNWINNFSAELSCRSYEECRQRWQPAGGPLMGVARGPEMTFTVDGREIVTRKDHICQTADDPYCYSLGWLKGQNLDISLISDPAAWQQQGASQCQMFKEKYGFLDSEITLGGHINETSAMYEKTDNVCSLMKGRTGPAVTARDYVKHAYAKCFMNNVSTEMAYCYFRGCILPSGRVGHRAECDY